MDLKPQNNKYVPLFEEHIAINERFMCLPDSMKDDIAKLLSEHEDAVLAGQLGRYLSGQSETQPTVIDIVVPDAQEIETEERGERGMEFSEEGDSCQMPDEEEMERMRLENEPVGEDEGEDGAVVVISVNPEGAIQEITPERERVSGEYDDEGNFKFESFKWVKGQPVGIENATCVFECRDRIKTMPIALGNITVLIEEPGVIANYKKIFANMKNSKSSKINSEKTMNFDGKNQPHVKNGNDLQDTPSK